MNVSATISAPDVTEVCTVCGEISDDGLEALAILLDSLDEETTMDASGAVEVSCM